MLRPDDVLIAREETAVRRDQELGRAIGLVSLLLGALTGQRELSESDRYDVAQWAVDHVNRSDVRDLVVKVISTEINDTSEFRQKVAEAIQEKFRVDGSAGIDTPTGADAVPTGTRGSPTGADEATGLSGHSRGTPDSSEH
ncbi:MAG: hypothetical protein ACYDES_11000 [Acidimicrobiales bacterium]